MSTATTLATLQPGDSIDAFREIYRDIAANLLRAAEMLYRLCDAEPDTLERLSSGPNAIPEGLLTSLLRVAEKSLHPRLLMNRCPSYKRLSTLAYSVQERALEKGVVELATGSGSGEFIKVDLVKLEGEALNQAIGRMGIRSLDEQRAYLRQRAAVEARPSVEDVGPPYEIKKGRLRIIRGNFELSKIELLRLLETMEAAS